MPEGRGTGRLQWQLRDGRRPLPDHPQSWRIETQDRLILGWRDEVEYVVDRQDATISGRSLGWSEADVQLGAALTAIPLALPFFEIEPFHAATIATSTGAICLFGESGAGKTTIASALCEGDPSAGLLAEDVAAVDRAGALLPGPPVFTFRGPRPPGDVAYDGKRVVMARGADTCAWPTLLVFLVPTHIDQPNARALPEGSALQNLLRFIRSPDVLTLERRPRQFAAAQKLASARAYRLEYPARFPQPRVLAAIIRDLPRATQGQRPRSD